MMDIAAVDMTLLLGAESFVRHRQPGGQAIPQDPVGRECLANLIDLLVNSEACFLLLPASDDYSVAPVLAQRISALKRLHNCAGVTLRKTTERRIVREFKRVMEDYDWLAQWFRAHWGDPQVPRHHSLAFGNLTKRFATITEEGWALWQQDFASSALRTPLSLAMPDESYLASDIAMAGNLATYQYAYAYDTFRRGWQYAASTTVSKHQLWYCPHRIRQRALEGGWADAWLENRRDRFWSWGRRIVRAIDASSHPIESARVADWINAICEAKPPRWMDVPDTIDDDRLPKQIRVAGVRDLVERIEAIADKARIPRELLGTHSLPIRIGEAALEIVKEELHIGAVVGVLNTLPANEAIEGVTERIGEVSKKAINLVRKGTFGHPDLISPNLRARSS